MSHCPWCEGDFKVCGSRKRVVYEQDGSKLQLIIRRLKCCQCQTISHELPDFVVPYKRYEAAAIAQALQEPALTAQVCGCETSTLVRWKLWFFLLHNYLEGALRSLQNFFGAAVSVKLPLYPLLLQPDGWLGQLVRSLVNSGRWRQTRSAS
ncbi:MAG: DUF6431 domain-containing protein [Lachnospiraceae bacterium]